MDVLVANLREAYRVSINDLAWDDAGHPAARWPNWTDSPPRSAIRPSGATTRRWPSAGMTCTATSSGAPGSTDRELGKLGGPVDRDEWLMTPQTVNAYYNPG